MADEIKDLIETEENIDEVVSLEAEPKPYEMGYLLSPLLPEEEAGKVVVFLRSTIESKGGMIVSEGMPEMRRLSYPISKQSSAYFGWMKFILKSNAVEEVHKAFKGEGNILRFLLINNNQKESKPLSSYSSGMNKTNLKPRTPEIVEKKSQPINDEEIDKKLEELISEEMAGV